MCWLLLLANLGYTAQPDPETLLRGAQSAREQIPPSRVTVNTVYHSEVRHNEFALTIEFDGDLRRFERSSLAANRPDYLRTLFDGKDAFAYDKSQVSIYNLSSQFPGPLHDPRVFGMVGVLNADLTIADCLPFAIATNVLLVGQEVIDQTPTFQVRMMSKDGTVWNWWISPEKGFQVLQFKENWGVGSRATRSWYENAEYQWLPSRVIVEQFGSNGGIISRTESKVVKAEVVEKFPKSTWTLAGFTLPAKTIIVDTRKKTFGYWIDGAILSSDEYNRLPPKGLRREKWTLRRFSIASILALGFLVPMILIVRRRRAAQIHG
jgi:hypothetical protein